MPENQTDATRVQFWAGTRAEFAAITVKQSNWLYFITDENVLYRGNQTFAKDIEKLLCFAANAPASASIGQQYYNSTTKKIYTYGASGWGTPLDPQTATVYFNIETANLYAWTGSAMANMSSTGSIVVQSTMQRMAYIPAIGAIIYDSTDGLVYVGDGVTTGGVVINNDLYTTVAQLAADVQIILDGGEPVQGTLACGTWTDNYDNVVQFGAWTAAG